MATLRGTDGDFRVFFLAHLFYTGKPAPGRVCEIALLGGMGAGETGLTAMRPGSKMQAAATGTSELHTGKLDAAGGHRPAPHAATG